MGIFSGILKIYVCPEYIVSIDADNVDDGTQLINHGVPVEVTEKMKVVMNEFFKQPHEEKMSCAQQPNSIEGYGQAFVVSEDQKLDWGDMLFLLAQPQSIKNLKLWPTNPTSFR